MGKSHEISLFATVIHGCKGKSNIFPVATVTEGCEEANFIGWSHYIADLQISKVQWVQQKIGRGTIIG